MLMRLGCLHLDFPNFILFTFSEVSRATYSDQAEDLHDEIDNLEDHPNGDSDNVVEENVEVDISKLSGRQKKLFELRLKMVIFRQKLIHNSLSFPILRANSSFYEHHVDFYLSCQVILCFVTYLQCSKSRSALVRQSATFERLIGI